jgi:hypothetical protein
VSVPAGRRYVRLSDSIWSGLPYTGFDTIVVHASAPIPAPISITGNCAGDRHLFFPAQPEPFPEAGALVGTDPIVGNLRYVPAGGFVQGSPIDEPCRDVGEHQFTHNLTRGLAVMETEVSRQMWADLKAAQATLPADPTNPACGAGMSHPVQNLTWYEAVLFANLLTAQRGLTPCYYADAVFTLPIDASNHTSGPFYCYLGFRLARLSAR